MSLRLTLESVNMEPLGPGSRYGPWTVRSYSLAWVIDGGGTSRFGRHQLRSRPGTVLLARPGQRISHQWRADAPSLQSFIVFELQSAPSNWPAPSRWPALRRFGPHNALFAVWRELLESRGQGPLAQASAEWILRSYVEGRSASPRPYRLKGLPSPVQRVLAFLTAELRRDPATRLHLADLARHAAVSPAHLCRSFSASLRNSPLRCLQLMKLESSAQDLEAGGSSLKELATKYGFSSPYHYSRAFKDCYGLAPSHYAHEFRQGLSVRPASLLYLQHALRRNVYDGPGGLIAKPGSPLRQSRRPAV